MEHFFSQRLFLLEAEILGEVLDVDVDVEREKRDRRGGSRKRTKGMGLEWLMCGGTAWHVEKVAKWVTGLVSQ